MSLQLLRHPYQISEELFRWRRQKAALLESWTQNPFGPLEALRYVEAVIRWLYCK